MESEDNYLAILSQQNLDGLLTAPEVLTIQAKLWDILGSRTASYTGETSSSIRVETAQELLKSACFVINHGLKQGFGLSVPNEDVNLESLKKRLLNEDFNELFKAGLDALKAQVAAGEALLEAANKSALAVENAAYRSTLKELGVFFKHYHYHHFAHDIPCMLDYPLAHPVDETLLGIDYINEYLRRFVFENDFCRRFDPDSITLLLKGVSPNYKDTLLSIYEAVAANALGLTLLKGSIFSLDITQNDIEKLYVFLGTSLEHEAGAKLRSAAAALCLQLDLTGPSADYLLETAAALQPRLIQCLALKRLEAIFPPLYRKSEDKKPAVTYIDGELMEDEALRTLIDEITDCRFLSDKITMVKQNVTSLRDLMEILGICFWEDECDALFDALDNAVIQHLKLAVRQKQSKYPDWESETGWENRL